MSRSSNSPINVPITIDKMSTRVFFPSDSPDIPINIVQRPRAVISDFSNLLGMPRFSSRPIVPPASTANTFTIVPSALGKTEDEQMTNLVALLDGYAKKGGFHLNVNVFDRELLLDAQKHPELYPQLTIRVSGYAVNFIKLTKEQQQDVISRTFHEKF